MKSILVKTSLTTSSDLIKQITKFLHQEKILPAASGGKSCQKIQLASLANPNLHWLNQEGSLKIKTVRELIGQAQFANYNQQTRIFVLLKIDTASIAAQNALLKIIEEPPAKTQIILTCQNLDKILPTIKSRCVLKHLKTGKNKPQNVSTQKIKNLESLAKQLTEPQNLKFSDLIEIASQYKDREQALTLTKNLIIILTKKNRQQPSLKLIKTIKTLNQAHQQLEGNANTSLALEHAFFKINS